MNITGPGRASNSPGLNSSALGATTAVVVGLTATAWVVSAHLMAGMDMGVATGLGSFNFFMSAWVVMMGAMMLPGALPTAVRWARVDGRIRALPLFVATYLVVWAMVGIAVYGVFRPHSTLVAGAVVMAAGIYEFTPLKRHHRQCCLVGARSGFEFGLHCLGSSAGLMAVLLAVGAMSLQWMIVIAVVIVAQKLIPPRRAVDVSVGLAIVGLGLLIVVAPSTVPGLSPAM